MNGKMMLYLDQFGHHYTARTLRELQARVGGGRVSKMYVDTKDGRPIHVGYVVGQHWLHAYTPFAQQQ